jgi:predicted O-linked N-acetylglucosamine transferase (SPINDLY family)
MTHTPAELVLLDRSFVDDVIAPVQDGDDLPQSDKRLEKGSKVISIETKLNRLPKGMFTYQPDKNAPDVSSLPALNNGYMTFGICADLMKINQASVECWSDVLRSVKGSKILVASQFFPSTVAQDHLLGLFASAGITSKRLEFFPVDNNFDNRFDCYQKIDMVLDPFPFGETLRNADAMWMGCPVLMCKHANHTSRLSQSVLVAAGREEWIAPDSAAYQRQIVALASDFKALNEIRLNLRDQLQQQPLLENERWARDFFKLALG